MEESVKKGTVTPLASVFSVEEAQKAAKRVEDAITDKHNELDRVRGFLADNNNIVNLVHKLPEKLSHDVMVPFGKAAFFPGRLIHTNEFLVLLGEGYYAERTSKQTADILQRRGASLNLQVDSLEANIKDLEAEVSFFSATASQVAEGLVEIREDFVEEVSNEGESNSGPPQQNANYVEYNHVLAIMDELEKEETAEESGNNIDQSTADLDENLRQSVPLNKTNNGIVANEFPKKHDHKEDITDHLNFANLAVQSRVRERENFSHHVESIDPSEKILSKKRTAQATTASKPEVRHQTSQTSFDSHKAFTGSIVEHAENIQTTSREQSSASSQTPGSQSSKPVSRFRMQRR